MISMYAEYSGRTLYVALSTVNIDGAKNGDTLYEMDTGKRYVYNESNDAWDEQPEEGGGGGPTENLVFKLHNQTGSIMNFISMFYDAADSNYTLFIYAQQSNNSKVQKTCLIQNGKVQLGYINDRNINSITYNGNPVPFTQSGSAGRRYVEFDVPANFDPDIDIIFT